MKTCKKLLALMLSVLMILSVIIIPAVAEEAVAENYVSLLDMSGLRAGIFTEGDNTVFPDGLADLGVSRWTPNDCGLSEMYSGKQEIVELEDGTKAWKINFDKAAKQNGHLWGSYGLLGFKITVPAKLVPYVTGVKFDVDNATAGGLCYRFGVSDGSHYATTNSNGPHAIATGVSTVAEFTTTQLRAYNSIYAATHTTALAETTWVDAGYESKEIYVIMSDSAAVDGGTGYTVIKDIGVTLSIPETDIPVEKEYSIFDLSEAEVGSTHTGDATIIADVAAAGVTTFSSGWNAYHAYNGTQEIVEVDGKKAWKINWDIAMSNDANLCDVGNEFMIKLPIPAKYIPYVTGVKAEVTNSSAKSTNVAFGFYNGSKVSWKSGNNSFDEVISNTTTDVVLERKVGDLKVRSDLYAGCPALTEQWTIGSATDVYLVMVNAGCNGTEGGYAIINDIVVTLTAAPSVFENMPVEKEISLLDLEEFSLGTISKLPESVERFKHSATNVVETVVEKGGKKALEIDFASAGFSGSGDRLTAQDGQAGYSPWYGISLSLGGYAPYVESITLKYSKDTSATIRHNFGVTDGSTHSKSGTGVNHYFASNVTGEGVLTYNVADLIKVNDWYFSRNGGGTTRWTEKTFNKVYFVFGATEATGTFTIEDIIIKTSASQSQYDNMPKSTTVNMLNLEGNELDVPTTIKYPKGVTSTGNYNGTTTVVKTANGKTGIKLDLASTTFTRKGSDTDKIGQGGYSPVYKLNLNIIPSTYVPYIDSIKVKFNKSADSQATIIYNFGVTDGSNYSKHTKNENTTIPVATTGEVVKEWQPTTQLYKVSDYYAGNWGGSDTKWDATYNGLFLWLSAYIPEGNTAGTLTIEEISYTYTMTDIEKAEADAKWTEMKSYVNNFESSGSESPYATSGTKVKVSDSGGDSGHSGATVALNTNIYIDESTGFSFWMYNPEESNQQVKMWLHLNDGTKFIIDTEYLVPAKSYKKVVVDYNKLYTNVGDLGSYSKGTPVKLTPEQIAQISSIQFMVRQGHKKLYLDDFYLIFAPIVDDKIGDAIVYNADNVKGGTVTADGKIEIPVAKDDQVVAITVPAGTFTEAGKLTYKLSSTATIATNLKFYMGLTLDNGKAGYVKIGQNPWSYSITADSTMDQVFDFFATRELCTFEGDYYINNWMGDGATHPTASEKATITTIYLGIKGYGDVAEAPTGSIFIEGFDLVNVGVKVKADTVEGGSTTIIDDMAFVGDQVSFIISPNDGYYLKDLKVVDSLGNDVAYDRNTETGADNLGLFYTFTAPAANVIIKPVFSAIDGTMPFVPAYKGDNLSIDFTIPFIDNQVYNESTYEFEKLEDYGVIMASNAALEKYGKTVEDLTPEFVDDIIESGHYLANFIYKLEGKDAIQTANNADFIKFTVDVTDVSVQSRRAPFAFATYAKFTNADGAESEPVNDYNYNTMDMFVYGENLVEEFYANNGINYQSKLDADISVWEDIYAQGFDHIRLPLTMTDRIDENYQLIEEKMAEVDCAITNALKAGFSVVVDTHSFGSDINISTNYEESAEIYNTVWEQLAERYANLPLSVAFQFVNEPDTYESDLDVAELMAFQEKLVKDCRAVEGNEERYMVISNHNNGSWELDQFTDSILSLGNIIVDIHYYTPMSFTHAGATWVKNEDGTIKYAAGATDYSEANIEETIADLEKFANDNDGVIVWVGEWGAYQPDYTAKVAYYAEVAEAFADAGIPWSLWEYGGGWSPYKNGQWDQELIEALFSFDGFNDSVTA